MELTVLAAVSASSRPSLPRSSQRAGTALPGASRRATRRCRARANFLETFPIAAAAIGAMVWLTARVLYVPVYALGIPGLRTALFATSIVGVGMLLWQALA